MECYCVCLGCLVIATDSFQICSVDTSDETDFVLSAHACRADTTTELSPRQVPIFAITSTLCLSLPARSDNRALAECNIPKFVLRPLGVCSTCGLLLPALLREEKHMNSRLTSCLRTFNNHQLPQQTGSSGILSPRPFASAYMVSLGNIVQWSRPAERSCTQPWSSWERHHLRNRPSCLGIHQFPDAVETAASGSSCGVLHPRRRLPRPFLPPLRRQEHPESV